MRKISSNYLYHNISYGILSTMLQVNNFLINFNHNFQTFKCFPITGTSNSRYEDIALLMLKQTINVHFAHRFSSDGNFFQVKHLYY